MYIYKNTQSVEMMNRSVGPQLVSTLILVPAGKEKPIVAVGYALYYGVAHCMAGDDCCWLLLGVESLRNE